MGELIGCFPLETVRPDMLSLSSGSRSSRSSLLSRETSSSSCTTVSSTLTVPERSFHSQQHKLSERVPQHIPDAWESAIARGQDPANLAIDSPSLVYPFALAFRKVPDNVLDRIARYVALLRSDDQHEATVTDLYSLCLTSSRWHKVACPRLYHKLWIHISDLSSKSWKFQLFSKTRLRLLRRTLKDNPQLCSHVRKIQVVGSQESRDRVTAKEARSYNDQIAAIIDPCENLEYFYGYKWIYTYQKDSVYRALSNKTKLKELVWNIGPNDRSWAEAKLLHPANSRQLVQDDQISSFVEFHSSFPNLESYAILCGPDADFHDRMLDSFQHMQKLKAVALSNLSKYEFADGHLPRLPSNLEQLGLEALPGLSELGLMDYFTNRLKLSDRSHLIQLDLINVNLHLLSGVRTILDHLYNLKKLKIVTSKLSLASDMNPENVLHPYISSKSLQHMHWEHSDLDTTSSDEDYESNGLVADTILAEAIMADGFPRLQTVCAPSDKQGIVQSICRPISRPLLRAVAIGAELKHSTPTAKPTDSHANGLHGPLIERATNAPGRGDAIRVESSRIETPTKATAHAAAAYGRAANAIHPQRSTGRDPQLGYNFNVIEGAEPYITLYVTEEIDEVKEMSEFPRFLGRIGPNVPEYVLSDEAG